MELAVRTGVWTPIGAPLPYDAEVEYLARTDTSSNGPYIITEIFGDNNLDFFIKAMCYDYNARTYFGSRRNYTTPDARIYNLVSGAERGDYGKFGFGNHVWSYWPTIGNIANEVFTAQKVGDIITSSAGTNFSVAGEPHFETPYELEIFAMSTVAQSRHNQEGLHGRIYELSFSRNGSKIADFIPVRVGPRESCVGFLYDRANPTGGPFGNGLYGNSNTTGAFVIGPDKASALDSSRGGGTKCLTRRRSYRRFSRPSARLCAHSHRWEVAA